MAKKDRSIKRWLEKSFENLDDLTENLWKIFVGIHQFWGRPAEELPRLLSSFEIFTANRLKTKPAYLFEYLNAIKVIEQLLMTSSNEAEAYRILCTDQAANIFPPNTELAKARQYVANEFASFYLSAGGFVMFGADLINYPGYIGGTNAQGRVPYIPYQKLPE